MRAGAPYTLSKRHVWARGSQLFGDKLHRHPRWRTYCENGRGGIFHCAVSRRRRTDTDLLFRGMLRRRRHFHCKFSLVKHPVALKQLPSLLRHKNLHFTLQCLCRCLHRCSLGHSSFNFSCTLTLQPAPSYQKESRTKLGRLQK